MNCGRNYSIRPTGKHSFNCNVIDCNIKLVGLNSKNLPAKQKNNVCRMRLILHSDVNCVIGGVLRGVNVIFGLGLVGRFVCGVVWASAAGVDIVG